jgi:dTDP-4-amino-4,6-dideoxygalactose transaminase
MQIPIPVAFQQVSMCITVYVVMAPINAGYVRAIRMLRDWGQDQKYHHLVHGFNYRMEGLQGAILRVKLRHLEPWTEARRAIAAKYNKLLADSELVLPSGPGTFIMPTHCALTIATLSKRPCKRKAFQSVFTIQCQYTCSRPTRSLCICSWLSRSRRRLPLRSSPCHCFRN